MSAKLIRQYLRTQEDGCDDYWQEVTPWMMGYASCLPVEQGDDAVRQLHEVVEEITGKPVDQAEKPRMGFLP